MKANYLIQKKLQKQLLLAKDAEKFVEFIDEYATKKSLSQRSINKYVHGVCGILSLLKKDGLSVLDLNRKTALNLIKTFQQHSWKPETKQTNWRVFKRFYRWLASRTEVDPGAYNILLGDDTRNDTGFTYRIKHLPQRDILTEDEFLRLLHGEHLLHWQALFTAMYEGAMSFIEISTLQVQDVEVQTRGYTLHVREGKNKHRLRPVELIEWSVAYMEKWLLKQSKRNPTDLLFVNKDGNPIRYAAANKRLAYLLKLADIDKNITTHCLRHSRLTSLGEFLNEFQLSAVAGWKQGSDMASRYVHSKQLNIRKKLLVKYGYSEEDIQQRKEAGKICPVCQQRNAWEAKRCGVCGSPTDSVALRGMLADYDAHKELLKQKLATEHKEFVENIVREILSQKENTQ